MRIVYLNPSGQMGGAETSLLELFASVRAAEPGWRLTLVLGEDGPLTKKAEALGVEVLVRPFPAALARVGDAIGRLGSVAASLPGTVLAAARYGLRLAGVLRELRPDLIHTNGFKMHLLGAWARPRQTPVVWHIHDYVRTRPLMSRLLRLHRRRCTMAIANSHSVARDLRALSPDLKIAPIYNSVNLERFAPTGKSLDLDAIAGLTAAAPDTIRVGLLGTFARWKGQKIFLQALARVAPEVPIRGYIIGGPIYQTVGSQWSRVELQEEAARLGLAGNVGFTGFLDDAAAAIRSLDVVVHASTEPEPFGMVIIEGMACGKPVIASQAGGACEIFQDGENALAHPAGDAAALAQKIRALACDSELRRRLGQAGRATAEQGFNCARLAKEVLAVYREVIRHSTESGGEPLAEVEFAALGQNSRRTANR